jgi:hypothetical protein
MSYLTAKYGRRHITVPNGRIITGRIVGLSAVTLLEHTLRDELATEVRGVTEATVGYGRADVLTADTVFEVEPFGAWRHAVRQAIQYAAQTGCQPAVALFGDAHRDVVLDIYIRLRDGKPFISLWWYSDNRWRNIGSRRECRAMRKPNAAAHPGPDKAEPGG